MATWPFRITDSLLDILEVFLDAEGELHGWEITKRAHRAGPTVYQVLERLRKSRWVAARWEEPPEAPDGTEDDQGERHRPRRRYYHLTDEGAANAPLLLTERRPRRTQRPRPAPGFAFRLRHLLGGAR